MSDCNAVNSPMEVGVQLSKQMSPRDESERVQMRNIPYRAAIGSLLFLSIVSRPDIAFAVAFLSRFSQDPGKSHWQAVKRVFRYLKGTIGFKLTYGRTTQMMEGYCDADFGGDVDERRSTSGYVFVLNGGSISWKSKRQPTVSLSTAEAEYIAAVDCIQEGTWLKALFSEVSGDCDFKMTIFADNKSAIRLLKNDNLVSQRTKHIDIKCKFLKQKIEKGEVEITYINTKDNLGDIFTKPIPGTQLMKALLLLGINH